MRTRSLLDTLELVIGTVVLCLGLGLSALSAAERSFIGVFSGFVLFILGYKLSQISVRTTTRSPLRDVVRDIVASAAAVDTLVVTVGAGTITYGFVLLFQSIETADIARAVGASVLMFVGYSMAHYAVNKTLV